MELDKRILSISAFALLILGVLPPFVPRIFGSGELGLVFAILATVLALVFGFLGRKFLLGKVAVVGVVVVFIISTTIYIMRSSSHPNDASVPPLEAKQIDSK
jgi:hypothetical protein